MQLLQCISNILTHLDSPIHPPRCWHSHSPLPCSHIFLNSFLFIISFSFIFYFFAQCNILSPPARFCPQYDLPSTGAGRWLFCTIPPPPPQNCTFLFFFHSHFYLPEPVPQHFLQRENKEYTRSMSRLLARSRPWSITWQP